MIHLLLDKSALMTYAAHEPRTMAVAELMLMVEENKGVVGIAGCALLEAYREVPSADHRGRLIRLATRAQGAIAVLPLRGGDVVPIARMWPELGHGDAHTVLDAMRHGASIATCVPDVFGDAVDESMLYQV